MEDGRPHIRSVKGTALRLTVRPDTGGAKRWHWPAMPFREYATSLAAQQAAQELNAAAKAIFQGPTASQPYSPEPGGHARHLREREFEFLGNFAGGFPDNFQRSYEG
jgi:hypothetical protein